MTTFQSVLTVLYSISNVAVVFGYIPQISYIVQAKDKCEHISALTYTIWGTAGALGCLYSAMVVGSFPLYTISSLHFSACTFIVSALNWKRIKYKDTI